MRYILPMVLLTLCACSTNYPAELAQAQRNIESQIGCSLGPVPTLVEDNSWTTVSAMENGKVLLAQDGKLAYSVWFKGLNEQERFAAFQRGLVSLRAPQYQQLGADADFTLTYNAGMTLKAACTNP